MATDRPRLSRPDRVFRDDPGRVGNPPLHLCGRATRHPTKPSIP